MLFRRTSTLNCAGGPPAVAFFFLYDGVGAVKSIASIEPCRCFSFRESVHLYTAEAQSSPGGAVLAFHARNSEHRGLAACMAAEFDWGNYAEGVGRQAVFQLSGG